MLSDGAVPYVYTKCLEKSRWWATDGEVNKIPVYNKVLKKFTLLKYFFEDIWVASYKQM